MYAIIEDGSHQFRVREGDRIQVNRRDGKAGDELVFPKVLFFGGGEGSPTIGTPVIEAPGRRQDRQPVQGQEDHHPEIPTPQEHAAEEWASPAVYRGSNHEPGQPA